MALLQELIRNPSLPSKDLQAAVSVSSAWSLWGVCRCGGLGVEGFVGMAADGWALGGYRDADIRRVDEGGGFRRTLAVCNR